MKNLINISVIAAIISVSWAGTCQASGTESIILSPPSSQNILDDSIAFNQTCINNDIGYRVSYPQDWQTNSGKVIDRCRVFDPHSATVPKYTESAEKAIYIWVEKNVLFASIVQEDVSEKHLSKQDTAIAGDRAVIVESESTGEALLAEGVRKYSYIVDLGNATLIATTYDITGNDYQKNKQILDRMMNTIEFNPQLVTINE